MAAGSSRGSDQPVFEIPTDTWFNLRTGVLTTLNYSDTHAGQSGAYSFDPQLEGQVVQFQSGKLANTYSQMVRMSCTAKYRVMQAC